MNIPFKNLDEAASFQKLQAIPRAAVNELLSVQRIEACQVPMASGMRYQYAAMPVADKHLEALQELADEMHCVDSYQELLSGAVMNTGESRMVLHHLTRGQLGADVTADGVNKREFYIRELQRIHEFSKKVHSGALCGSTGRPFDTVVQIGIGGSDLGPRALSIALKGFASSQGRKPAMRAKFISNVDPDDAAEVLETVNPETVLFIIVTKSGTTQETLANRELVRSWMERCSVPGLKPDEHMVAVTSETSPLAKSSAFLTSFYMDDYIGGRYSATSAVGGLILSLAFGAELFLDVLAGAHESDRLALNCDITKNPSLLDALIGVYLRNVLNCPATAVLPYSQALSRFPAHLQQLDMESSGKRVNRSGQPVPYPTGPVVFGEPGTNGQHSFYQLLHQGTDMVPLQFIGFTSSQRSFDISSGGSTSQEKLLANLAAQITAFTRGQDHEDPSKQFPGGRPSSLIAGDQLTPRALGVLLAHFENKIMFQGFLWNINSFDQEGVQLGKKLTEQLLAPHSGADESLHAFFTFLKQ